MHTLRHVTSTLRTREQPAAGRHDPRRHLAMGLAVLGLIAATAIPATASPSAGVAARETLQTSVPLPTGVIEPEPVRAPVEEEPSEQLWKHMPPARLIADGPATDLSGAEARAAYLGVQGIGVPTGAGSAECFPGLDTDAVAMRLVERGNGGDPIAIVVQRAERPLSAAEDSLRACRFMSLETEQGGTVEIDSVLLPRPMVQADQSLALERHVTSRPNRGAHAILALAAQVGDVRVIALTVSATEARPASDPLHAAFLAAIDQLDRTI
ncbi:hypothetical protein HT102_02635 [Hoyosella sp. G463]|uniref:DUF5642 domain-containing protein n=1 Tax=Lolliginicoccus lacisalsi TaxID=2742202 RepID=A0A927PJX8_9ACTN|nr:hypothetical protein [Lolliginicoccus lacisalsi]MBD8505385.1 hypothetical protein [Lolliginicoccus lacisalsi]